MDACRAEAANCNREPYEKMESEMVCTPVVHFFPFCFAVSVSKLNIRKRVPFISRGCWGSKNGKQGLGMRVERSWRTKTVILRHGTGFSLVYSRSFEGYGCLIEILMDQKMEDGMAITI